MLPNQPPKFLRKRRKRLRTEVPLNHRSIQQKTIRLLPVTPSKKKKNPSVMNRSSTQTIKRMNRKMNMNKKKNRKNGQDGNGTMKLRIMSENPMHQCMMNSLLKKNG